MGAARRTVARTLTALAVAFAAFVCLLMVLPEPAPPPSVAEHAAPFAIVGVKVFDGGAFLPDRDVWVEKGRVRRVGQELDLPADLARIDGRGRTLLPGLVDGHVHTFGDSLADAARFGVTTVLDHFTDPRLAASKRPARNSLAPGDEADLFSAGMLATATGGHGTQYGIAVEPVAGPDAASAWVRARKAAGSDWIKIVHEDGRTFGQRFPTLDRDTIAALIAAAHDVGLLAVVHVSTLGHSLDAVALGADGLVHVWHDTVIDRAQAERIAGSGAFVIPTLSVTASISGDPMAQELMVVVGDAQLSEMQRLSLTSRFPGGDSETTSLVHDVATENVRRLRDAGVPLIAGTDAPNPGTAFGLSMHGELRLLARAGLSPAEALAAATSAGADAFGIEERGRIREGGIADVVLVEGDLERDLSVSTRIVAVWKDGYTVGREWADGERPVIVGARSKR